MYGEPFKDEFHQRLRFSRRGLVAMANAGRHDNGSQFFFTLGPTPELQDKHTLFGKVVGDTLFNMLKIGEGTTDKNERPVNPVKVTGAEILNNPFDDIAPRELKRRKEDRREKKPKSKMKPTKNFGLLSFGDEAEEEDEQVEEMNKKISKKGKSAHDVLGSADPKLSSEPAVKPEELRNQDGTIEDNDDEDREALKNRIKEKLRRKERTNERDKQKKLKSENNMEEDEEDFGSLMKDESTTEKKKEMETLKAEFKKLQKEMAKSKKKDETPKEPEVIQETEAQLAYKAERGKYEELKKVELKRKSASRENETLQMLEKFRNKLENQKASTSAPAEEEAKEEESEIVEEDMVEDIPGDDW